ncbi:MAG: anaerobic sulfatase maturase [Pseudomonadales bacterium]|uniref:anaerobic sulfatase maturase n=1 Tax=Alcanivorax sp. TaxID=1872427 RepID=UPI003C326902
MVAKSGAPFHVLAKPIGPLCNLDCEYCFYLEKTSMFPGSKFHMTDDVLEAHIRGYIESQPDDSAEVNFAWQGGEPTLLGLDYFKRVVELQQRYQRPGMKISNSLQTNGTKLDIAWCQFLRANQFLVGISIDGPEELHDRYRVTKGGKGSFHQVKRGLDHLIAENVDYNVLTVVQRDNGDHPDEVYEGIKAMGAEFFQFIPIVERTGGQGVTDRSVLPGQFGEFMVRVFELWRQGDIGAVFVQHFDAALNAAVGNPYTVCVHAPECGRSVAIEHNGDLFSCDHYVEDEYRLGNINSQGYAAMLDGDLQTEFGRSKLTKLPAKCVECSIRYLCHGGCPAQRFIPAEQHDLNYLCDGYFRFFSHIAPYMEAMKLALENGETANQYFRYMTLKVGRNDPCPCGSGRKYKRCCES